MKRFLSALFFIVCLLPLIGFIVGIITNNLGANPIETLLRETGEWTLRFLILTLCVSPFYQMTGWHHFNKTVNLGKLFGLYAFFYSCLHLFIYLIFEQSFDWMAIFNDILERPAISVGFIAFVLMIPLVATSNRAMINRLGISRWKRLHQLTYLVTIGGIVHFWWLAQAKVDIREPLVYATIVGILLVMRYPPKIQ
jgi:methionine sulfoxide reductase heme-binding subunit